MNRGLTVANVTAAFYTNTDHLNISKINLQNILPRLRFF